MAGIEGTLEDFGEVRATVIGTDLRRNALREADRGQTQDSREGLPRGASSGWSNVDDIFTLNPGSLVIVTGTPGSGAGWWWVGLGLLVVAAAGGGLALARRRR